MCVVAGCSIKTIGRSFGAYISEKQNSKQLGLSLGSVQVQTGQVYSSMMISDHFKMIVKKPGFIHKGFQYTRE